MNGLQLDNSRNQESGRATIILILMQVRDNGHSSRSHENDHNHFRMHSKIISWWVGCENEKNKGVKNASVAFVDSCDCSELSCQVSE